MKALLFYLYLLSFFLVPEIQAAEQSGKSCSNLMTGEFEAAKSLWFEGRELEGLTHFRELLERHPGISADKAVSFLHWSFHALKTKPVAASVLIPEIERIIRFITRLRFDANTSAFTNGWRFDSFLVNALAKFTFDASASPSTSHLKDELEAFVASVLPPGSLKLQYFSARLSSQPVSSDLQEAFDQNLRSISSFDELADSLQNLIERLIDSRHGSFALSYLGNYENRLRPWFYPAAHWAARYLVEPQNPQLSFELEIEGRLASLAALLFHRCHQIGQAPDPAVLDLKRLLYFLPTLACVLESSPDPSEEVWDLYRELYLKTQDVISILTQMELRGGLDYFTDDSSLEDNDRIHWLIDAEVALQGHYGITELHDYMQAHQLPLPNNSKDLPKK